MGSEQGLRRLWEALDARRIGRREFVRRAVALGVPVAVALAVADGRGRSAEAAAAHAPLLAGRAPSPNGPSARRSIPGGPPGPFPRPSDVRRFVRPTPRPSVTVAFDDRLLQGELVARVDNLGTSLEAYHARSWRSATNLSRHPNRDWRALTLELANLGTRAVSVALQGPGGVALSAVVAPADVTVLWPWVNGTGTAVVSANAAVAGFGYAL